MSKKRSITGVLAALLFIAASALAAQLGNPFNERDDTFPLLGVKRAQAFYEQAKTDLERTEKLFAEELVSKSELDRSRSTFADAEVNYMQSLLAAIFERQYVAILGAVKYQAEDGKKHVRLTLQNTSGGGAEFESLVSLDRELFEALRPDVIHDVYVSLIDEDDAIVSTPYESKLEELRYGQPATIDFALLRDLDAVTVGISWGNGSNRSPKVSLEKDTSVNRVLLQSEQFSQEAELGSSADFDLNLELFSGDNDTFKLEVVNLPPQLNRTFIDPESEARLTQVKFTEGNNNRQAALRVSLPDRAGEGFDMDRPISFYALAVPRQQAQELGRLTDRQWTEDEIKELEVGYVRFELVPRGVGELLVRLPRLFFSTLADEPVDIAVELENEGTQRLNNVELKVDLPLNWSKTIEPPLIPALEVGEERRAIVTVVPAPGVTVGKYEVRLQSAALSDNEPVEGEDKTVTVEIEAEAQVLGLVAVVVSIVGLVLGIVIFGLKLSRR